MIEFDEKIKKCIVCSSHDIKDNKIDFREINISKCRGCGFQFMNPQYTDGYLSEYYSQYLNGEDFDLWHEALLERHHFYFSLFEKYINSGKVLDVGCGNGYLLEVAISRGWSARGYDVDEKSTQAVSVRLGVEVDHGDFISGNLGDGYDLVIMYQVLEHLKDPNKYLRKIHSILKTDGYLFVAVPNIKSLSNRLKYYLEQKGLRRKNIGKYYDSVHHVLYFEPQTLAALLGQHGFEVVQQRNCYGTRPNQSRLGRFMIRNVTDHLFAKSAFLFIAKKSDHATRN